MTDVIECLRAISGLCDAAREMTPIIHDDQNPSPEAVALADTLDTAVAEGERVLRAAGRADR